MTSPIFWAQTFQVWQSIDNATYFIGKKYQRIFISVDANIAEEPREKKLRWDQPEDVIKKILDARQLLHEHNGDTSAKMGHNK